MDIVDALVSGPGPTGPSGVDIPTLVSTDVTLGSGTQATTGRTISVNYTGWGNFSANGGMARAARGE